MATKSNSVPFSTLHPNTTRKGSTISGNQAILKQSQVQITPRALSPSFTNILPSNQSTVSGASSTKNAARTTGASATSIEKVVGIEAGSGPLRLPKPLTAVDLYAQLEKEQEAVVNRLTRELSLLRAAQNTSVVSSVSSNSVSGLQDNCEYDASGFLSGHCSHPTPSYFSRNRSSSAVSSRSLTSINPTSFISCAAVDRAAGRSGHTRRESNPGTNMAGYSPSRRNSASKFNLQGQNQSGASSPIAVPINPPNYHHRHHVQEQWPIISPSRSTLQLDYTSQSQNTVGSLGEKEIQLNNRFEEVAKHSIELENAKKENESLRQRVKELELLLSQKKEKVEVSVEKPLKNQNCSSALSKEKGDIDLSL